MSGYVEHGRGCIAAQCFQAEMVSSILTTTLKAFKEEHFHLLLALDKT